MSEYAAKNPAIDSGYEDKQSTSTSNDEGQSQTVTTFRVYVNRVPANMAEAEVYEIILAMVDVKPSYFKMCWQNANSNRYRGDINEQYCIVEYDQENNCRALVDALHLKPPNNFDLNFRVHERTLRGGYRTQQFYPSQQRGGHQQRYNQQQNTSAGNYPHRYNNSGYYNKRGNYHHQYNNNNNISRMPNKASPARGLSPSYLKKNEDFNSYVFSSSPNANGVPVQFPPEFARPMAMPGPHPHLMLLGGVQLCYGCGAMTQSNCSTCFTPFCSGFCLSKLTNPSHPHECHSMFVTSPHQVVGNNQPNFVWMQQQHLQQQQQSDDAPKSNKNNAKRKAKQLALQNGQVVDKADIGAIEAGVKDLTLLDKPSVAPVPPAVLLHQAPPPQVTNTPVAYVPLTPTSTPNSTPPMAQVETKQYRKVTSPPKVEINKSPDNNLVKPNPTGNSPHTATPPAVQTMEPFMVTPQQMAGKMMVPPPGAMMMMHQPMPHGQMMAGPGGPPQPVYVLLPNQQLMMAPYYGAGGDFMPPPAANYGEQPQFEYAQQQPPAFEFAQNQQPMAFNPHMPPQGMQQMPQPYFYSNFQAY